MAAAPPHVFRFAGRALWSIAEVTRRVGTPSVRGVGIGEDWVVIAHRTGLYIFSGGEPVKISQEIQPTWNKINWQYGHALRVAVDTKERRIFIGAPMGTATSPNQILMLDYRDLDSAEDIAGRPPLTITYTGRKTATDKTREWSPWRIAANCAARGRNSDHRAWCRHSELLHDALFSRARG